jgi:hypothetical protein
MSVVQGKIGLHVKDVLDVFASSKAGETPQRTIAIAK